MLTKENTKNNIHAAKLLSEFMPYEILEEDTYWLFVF
jgi:hypothetical protein